jgi:hypothetical protein
MSNYGGCENCIHNNGATCAAYPNGIPAAVRSGQIPHDKSLPDDRGVSYFPNERYQQEVLGIVLPRIVVAQARNFSKMYTKNCGTGAGGFQQGNTCATGDGGGSAKPSYEIVDGDSKDSQSLTGGGQVLYLISPQEEKAMYVGTLYNQMLSKVDVDGANDLKEAELQWWTGTGYNVLGGGRYSEDQIDKVVYANLPKNSAQASQLGIGDEFAEWRRGNLPESRMKEIEAKFAQTARETRARMEQAAEKSRFKKDITLYRYLQLSTPKLEAMLSSGVVEHPRLNSWTTNIAELKHGRESNVIVRVNNARAGMINHVNYDAQTGHESNEREIIRPASKMRIVKVTRDSKLGNYLIDVEEDPRFLTPKKAFVKNCGTGSGGFQQGNTCASGGGGGGAERTPIEVEDVGYLSPNSDVFMQSWATTSSEDRRKAEDSAMFLLEDDEYARVEDLAREDGPKRDENKEIQDWTYMRTGSPEVAQEISAEHVGYLNLYEGEGFEWMRKDFGEAKLNKGSIVSQLRQDLPNLNFHLGDDDKLGELEDATMSYKLEETKILKDWNRKETLLSNGVLLALGDKQNTKILNERKKLVEDYKDWLKTPNAAEQIRAEFGINLTNNMTVDESTTDVERLLTRSGWDEETRRNMNSQAVRLFINERREKDFTENAQLKKSGDIINRAMREKRQRVEDVLAKSKLPKPMNMYRYLRLNDAAVEQLAKDGVLTEKSFSSWTPNPMNMKNFQGANVVVREIDAKDGYPNERNWGESTFRKEYEVLRSPNQFEIVKIKKASSKGVWGRKQSVYLIDVKQKTTRQQKGWRVVVV